MSTAIWHDVECAGYKADLPLWEELADRAAGPVLELGCGTGRVILHLAGRGASLALGLDRDPELVACVWERASGSAADAELLDVRSFDLPTDFALVLAPMQLIQLLGNRRDRVDCLSCVAECLTTDGRAAFAIVEEVALAPLETPSPPLPDVRQVEGWIYSSLPLEILGDSESIVLRRLRQTVSPEGELDDEVNEVRLSLLSADMLEREAAEAGLQPAGRREIPATDTHVGSTVVLLRRVA
jgi:SAM-dependent methyltransferase